MQNKFAAVVVATAGMLLGFGCGVEEPSDEVARGFDDEGGGEGTGGSGNDGGAKTHAASQIVEAQVTGLVGKGLLLRTSAGQVIVVTSDGQVTLDPPVPSGDGAVTVLSQPVEPDQVCSGSVGTGGMVNVSCTTQIHKLGGTVTGLVGSGLVLETGSGERVAVTQNGPFQFAGFVAEQQSYEVRVAAQPTAPRQTCVVADGSGRVARQDVTQPSIQCATTKFTVGGEVLGLTGPGLVLALNGGQQKPITSDGEFAFDALADGSRFSVIVAQLPASNQKCQVVQGEGVLDGQDVMDVAVVCGSLGNLRITEVGSCPYVDSACWVELTNVGEKLENLGAHQLRTPARRLSTKEATRTFALPDLLVRPGDYVVVRARSSESLPDGGGIVHVSDQGFLPWWDSSGFVELITSNGTEDFMRFGSNRTRALSAFDAWQWDEGVSEAPSLPGMELGRSLARNRAVRDTGGAKDWVVRAFATPGGPNDVTSDVDADEDGVPDTSEVAGSTFAGLDLYAMGARVGQRDVFVEVDRMMSTDPAVIPREVALDKVVAAFARHKIALHFDVGDLFAAGFSPQRYNLGGGSVVPFWKAVGFRPADTATFADLYAYKAAHMAAPRRAIFYYMLFASSQQPDGGRGASGVGEVRGNDSIITLGAYGLNVSDNISRNVLTNIQALTVMHELGHNFGLFHGGHDKLNNKPNYVSVMNYLYSLGLPSIGTAAEGDRYHLEIDCTLRYLNQLSNSPAGDPASFVIDFSDGLGADISEASVDERAGLGRLDSAAVDFNCNKKMDAAYARDLNLDARAGDNLSDHDDWSALELVFRRNRFALETGSYFPGIGIRAAEEVREDLLTDDQQEVVERPCPPLRLH